MAFSPLSSDLKTVKEFNITAEAELTKEEKLAHCYAQVQEVKRYLWRTRVDLTIAEVQSKSEDPKVAAESASRIIQYKSEIKQVVTSITIFNQLIKELDK